jgi:adenosylcobyric acid synthase
VCGSYVHGLFAADEFRAAFLRELGGSGSDLQYEVRVERALDGLVDHLERHLDIDRLLEIAGAHSRTSETTEAITKTSAQAPV